MQTPPEGMHLCPTRTDGEAALIARIISVGECQKRQREHFHKCPTCMHENARVASAPVLPPREMSEATRPPAD